MRIKGDVTKAVLSWIIVLFFLSMVVLSGVDACAVSEGDPWFVPRVKIDDQTLPDGIHIVEREWRRGHRSYFIYNSGEETLYLVLKRSPDGASPQEIFQGKKESQTPSDPDLPETLVPLYRITSESKMRWLAGGPDHKWRWWEDKEGRERKEIGLEWLLDKNGFKLKNIYGDGRPADVEVPQEHTVEILGYYKDELISIRGRVSYQLNSQYNPHLQSAEMAGCGQD